MAPTRHGRYPHFDPVAPWETRLPADRIGPSDLDLERVGITRGDIAWAEEQTQAEAEAEAAHQARQQAAADAAAVAEHRRLAEYELSVEDYVARFNKDRRV